MVSFTAEWRSLLAAIALVAAALRAGSRAGAPPVHSRRLRSCGCRRTRHGGRAGEDRGANGRRYPAAGRQCGRCRRRDRLCAGRDLSARRKHRRRRLHDHPLGGAPRGRRHRLPRDRACRDDARHLPRRRRQARHREIARFRAQHRRARHRRGPGAGAGEIRLGKIHAGGSARAGHRARARRLRHRRRHGRHLARHRAAAGALAGIGQDIFPRRRQLPAGRRQAGAGRSRGHALGHRGAGTARILRGPGRGEAGSGDSRGRRHHDGGRSQVLSARDPRAGARQLPRATRSSRCRRRRRAAWCCWRR